MYGTGHLSWPNHITSCPSACNSRLCTSSAYRCGYVSLCSLIGQANRDSFWFTRVKRPLTTCRTCFVRPWNTQEHSPPFLLTPGKCKYLTLPGQSCTRNANTHTNRPQLSIHRLDASIGGPANPVYVGQSCNWPYSDAACLNSSSGDRVLTMSQAFIEHVTCLKNWSSRDSIMPAPANSF